MKVIRTNEKDHIKKRKISSLIPLLVILSLIFLLYTSYNIIIIFTSQYKDSEKLALPIVYSNKDVSKSIKQKLTDNNLLLTYESEVDSIAIVSATIDEEQKCVAITKSLLVPIVNPKSNIDIIQKDESYNYVSHVFTQPNNLQELKVESIEKTSLPKETFKKLDSDKNSIGLVYFEELDPQYRLLNIEGEITLEPSEDYPFSKPHYICSENQAILPKDIVGYSNFNPKELLTVTQTGVTAITRKLALKMEQENDYDYPAEQIADELKEADITHISNEVSFTDTCQPTLDTLRFCSNTNYLEALKTADIDIVELTGNHNNDAGYSANTYSVDLYEENDMKYFGGGRDLEDAQDILYIEEKGTTLAFLGYNYYDSFHKNTWALATETHPGANPYSEEKLKSNIIEAQEKADIVIVDFQFQECWAYQDTTPWHCYQPLDYPNQEELFKKAIDFGANIVVGTQAHMPQVIENYKEGVIFYGLGNLWFDQTNWEWTRQGMILTHLFYKGEYLNTIVKPTYYDEDMQVYLPKGEKRKKLLDIYYER